MTARPITIWAVSDGRAGIQNQVLGLAEAVARIVPATVLTRHIRYAPAFAWLPSALKLWPDAMLTRDSDAVSSPYPDIWIGAGRATIPHSVGMRQRSGGQTMVVQLQDPKWDVHAFDLVIAPEHDHVEGGNVLSLIGSTNRISAERLARDYTAWQTRVEALPQPRVAVLIGGTSKAFDLDVERAGVIAAEIHGAVTQAGGSLLLTVSRRTPDDARAVFDKVLKDVPGIIWDGQGDNPYFAFLHAADRFLVTEDSVNMATEAAATGKPVQIISLERRSLSSGEKFEDFHEVLRARGVSHPFDGSLRGEAYPPLRETDRAAEHVVALWRKKSGEG